jgi:hypothetical protein
MPTKRARKGARNAKRRGNKPSTQAGSYVKEQMRRKKHGGGGKRRPKSRKQAIAIGLSEARRSGVKVPKKKSRGRKSSKKK